MKSRYIPLSARKKANKRRPRSGLEKAFYTLLDELGINYKKEYKISRLHVDIFIQPNLVIELSGCFWHKCSCLKPKGGWKPSDLVVKERDKRRYAFLESKGFIVREIWECEMKEIKKVSKKVLSWIKDL